MERDQIKVGRKYIARINGNETPVQVTADKGYIQPYFAASCQKTIGRRRALGWEVCNLNSQRYITVKSPAQFVRPLLEEMASNGQK